MKREFNLRKIAYIVLFFICAFLSIMYGCNEKNESIVNNDILSLDKNTITFYIDETITITANIFLHPIFCFTVLTHSYIAMFANNIIISMIRYYF